MSFPRDLVEERLAVEREIALLRKVAEAALEYRQAQEVRQESVRQADFGAYDVARQALSALTQQLDDALAAVGMKVA
jgi:hypothetical protein